MRKRRESGGSAGLPRLARLSCILIASGGVVAGVVALAPPSNTKEQMHEHMQAIAQQMEDLKPQVHQSKQAARHYQDLAAQYAQLSDALGGDDPGRVSIDQEPGAQPVGAAAGTIPPPPPGCGPATVAFTNGTPVTIPTGPAVVASTITVGGALPFLWDLNLSTFITHTFNGDLDITLTSPGGTIVTVTTDNAGTNDNVFNGTDWDDDANPLGQVPYVNNDGLVTDSLYANLVVETPLVPEEAFGAFIGEDPNGDWTLTISDDAAGDGGILAVWTLEITTLDKAPTPTTVTITNPITLTIPTGPAVVTSTITVAGVTNPICDLDLTTFITHTFNGDLDITLASPAGTVVTITTDNAGTNENVYNGTFWNDDANPLGPVPYINNDGLVTDSLYANLIVETPLVVEEAFAAFNGEDPNGDWLLTISDDAAGDGGALSGWGLDITTCECPPGQIKVYFDPISFEEALIAAGKLQKAFWNFKPHILPPGVPVPLNDLLDINSHGTNPGDPWTTPGGGNLWPPTLDNVQFSANEFPQQPQFQPHGFQGLLFGSQGYQGYDNNVLVANNFYDSFDIISGPPAGTNHTAIGLELVSIPPGAPFVHVTIYDKEGLELAKVIVSVPPLQKVFIGILRKDRETIGRIDIWNPDGGFEGISAIALYENPVTCPWDCALPPDGVIDVVDFLALLGGWGFPGPCDFDGINGVDVVDFLKLLGAWGPCP